MNQLCKLDFWGYLAYLNNATASQVSLLYNTNILENRNNIKDIISKSSGGKMEWRATAGDANAGIACVRQTATPLMTTYGETWYKKGTSYFSMLFSPSPEAGGVGALFASAQGENDIDAESGFEMHYNDYQASTVTTNLSASFSIDGVTYLLQWTTNNGLWLCDATNTGVNLLTRNIADNATTPTWRAMKIRAFVSGGFLYVKVQSTQGAVNVIAFSKIAVTNTVFSNIRTPSATSSGNNRINNFSLYVVDSVSQVGTYAATIEADILASTFTNDMLPFQRYTPLLDLIPIFGTDWTGSDGTAAQDLSDGDLTTYATTEDKDTPIGFIASDGFVVDGSNNPIAFDTVANEWYMVAIAGDYSSAGAPAGTSAVGTVFLADAVVTQAAGSLYPLLTMGDLMGRTYSWTPGTLTQLPTIGIIRNGSSMAFSVANTEAEDIRFKFGVPVDGSNVSALNYVQADVTTGGNPFGETLATNNFDNGSGQFTDGTNTHTFLTSHPVIFTLERKS